MQLYTWYIQLVSFFVQNTSLIKIDKVKKNKKSVKLYNIPLS